MSTLTEYFAKKAITEKYSMGDRVAGKFGKIPFMGTVGNCSSMNAEGVSVAIVHLDLPIIINDTTSYFISVLSRTLRPLKELTL